MKYLFSGIFILVILSVYIIRQSGYNPKPILTMKASKYESPTIVGNGLFRRFFKEAQSINHFYIFCEPEQCSKIKIWKSFLNQSNLYKLEKRRVSAHESLSFASQDISSSKSIFFYPLAMEKEVSVNPVSSIIFYMADFYVNSSEEKNLPKCTDVKRFKDLDCLSLNFSRKFYKKKFNSKNNHVGMEQISHNKYVIYLN